MSLSKRIPKITSKPQEPGEKFGTDTCSLSLPREPALQRPQLRILVFTMVRQQILEILSHLVCGPVSQKLANA
jgi:hypothetical protein